MNAEICPIWTNLFHKDNIYFLPKYQRAYSWQKTQLDDFWHDINDAMSRNPELPYLLGTLYLAEVDIKTIKKEVNDEVWAHYEDGKEQGEHYLIIDGQQRITTFFMLQLALDEKQNLFSGSLPKLALGKVDFEFLKALTEDQKITPLTNSNRNLEFTYNYFKTKINALEGKDEFLDFLRNNLQAVFITLTSNLELATTLFVSQTDRGKKLTVLDKLKSSLMFYVKRTALTGSLKIDNLFGELYINIEYLVSLKLYKNSSDMESDIIRILHVLLKKKDFYDTATLGELKSKVGWEIGESRVYDAIGVMLRDSQARERERCIRILYDTLNEIKHFFDYVFHIRENELKNQFLDPYDNVTWYPYLQMFSLLKPTRFSKALLVELYAKLKLENSKNTLLHFIQPGDVDTRSDSVLMVNTKESVNVLTKDIISDKYLKLQTLFTRTPSDYHDVSQIQKHDEILKLLQQKISRTLQRVNDFQYYLDNRYISLINLIEKTEMSIWKNGKRPIGNFVKNEKDANKLLVHSMNFIYKYKEKNNYLLRDFGFSNIKYLLLEYERMIYKNSDNYQNILNLELDDDDGVTIQREHIYPVNPDEHIESKVKEIWYDNNKERYENWIWHIGNVTLLEHNINIGNASNKTVWDKAIIYKKHNTVFLHTQELADDIIEAKTLLDNLEIKEDDQVTHYTFKLLLEIRELELLSFLYCRF